MSFQDKFPNLTTVEIDASKYNDILNLYSKEHSISDTMEYGIELAMRDLMEEVSKQVEEYCLDKQLVRETLDRLEQLYEEEAEHPACIAVIKEVRDELDL